MRETRLAAIGPAGEPRAFHDSADDAEALFIDLEAAGPPVSRGSPGGP